MSRKRILENKQSRLEKILSLKEGHVDHGTNSVDSVDQSNKLVDPLHDSPKLRKDEENPVTKSTQDIDTSNDTNQQYYISQTQMEYFHSITFNVLTTIAFWFWLVNHSHTGNLTVINKKWYIKGCKELNHMRKNPVSNHQSSMMVGGKEFEWWVAYLSLEMVLISTRIFLIMVSGSNQNKRLKKHVMVIPMQDIAGKFINVEYWQGVVNQLWEYVEIYNVFMADMYFVIVMMGVGVILAWIGELIHIC